MESLSSKTGTMPSKKPDNYLILAILTTIFCCQITGIISIVYASRVNSKWDGGDYAGAEEDSKNAKLWGFIGLIGGGLLVIILILAAVASAIIDGGLN